jgi:signal transduction histidine kinase
LRTPLTVLKGELESLVQQQEFTSDWRDRVGSALEEVDRLSQIVEGLFAISRLDAGEAASEWVALNLAQLTEATVDQMSLLADDKGINVTCEASTGIWVEGDRSTPKTGCGQPFGQCHQIYSPRRGNLVDGINARQPRRSRSDR